MNESLDQPQAADRLAPKRPDPSAPAAAAPDVTSGGAARTHEAGATAATPATSSTGSQFLTVFPPIMLPMFLAAVDQTLLATATPAIAADLGGLRDTTWIALAYLMASTVTVR